MTATITNKEKVSKTKKVFHIVAAPCNTSSFTSLAKPVNQLPDICNILEGFVSPKAI
jgi:hypothetical protein